MSHREFSRKLNNGLLVEASVGADLNLRTMASLRLYCNATGYPPPEMVWEIREHRGNRGLRTVVSKTLHFER